MPLALGLLRRRRVAPPADRPETRRSPEFARCCSSHHAWVGFGNPLAEEDVGHPAVDVGHDKRRSPKLSHDLLEQQVDSCRFTGIARVAAHAVPLLQILQDRFVRIPGGDANTQRRRSCAAALANPALDAGAAPNDECSVSS